MSSIPFLTIIAGSENVSNASFVDIDFSAAGLVTMPIINASIEQNIEAFITDITTTSARINFSSQYSGKVSYIIRPAST